MNKNILIVLGGAVLVAFLVAMLVQASIGKKEAPPVQVAKDVNILIAAKDLRAGTILAEGDTGWKSWPENAIFPGAIIQKGEQSPVDALSGRLKEDIRIGDPVLSSSVLSGREGNVVANVLPEGMRAVSIPVSAESMVAGFIKPNDYVDVVLTYKASFSTNDPSPKVQEMVQRNLDRMAVETILQHVKVLAVDQSASNDKADGKDTGSDAKLGKTVTLAVSREDAEKLVLAGQLGKLTLVLRGLGDQDVTPPSWPTVTDKRMTKIEDEMFTAYDKMKKDTGVNPDIVRIYSGETLSTSVVH
ncbi:MAG: Flp pilus assembly protein CpaB [Alphaproteobacteria bacterium]|nr:Flp pilus assembly protein CpaB [Alphaproteobacteria bacterium]